MSNEEKEDYLKYIENYTLNDLADEFNTQNFIIKDKDKFNEILLYYHFKEVDEIEQLQQENKQLKDNWNKLKEWLKEYEEGTYGLGSYETGLSDGLGDVIKKMQEIQGSRE